MKIVSIADLPERQVSHNPDIKKKVMLEKDDLPHVTTFSQAYFAPGQVASLHAHEDMYEVFFVEAGAGVIRVDGEPHPLSPGTCVVVAPGEVHEVTSSGPGDLVLTYFGVEEGTR
jgi:mannose-6-phosphate isomerase-like protein (cupin superfamily)